MGAHHVVNSRDAGQLEAIAGSLDRLRDGPYLRLLRLAIRERYITALIFTGLLNSMSGSSIATAVPTPEYD